MPKPKGSPKTGGRKPGTPNRKTLVIEERLAEIGCDPFELLAYVAIGKGIEARLSAQAENSNPVQQVPTLDQRIAAAKELAQYIAPKRKAIEGPPNGGNPVEMVLRWSE